MNTTYIPVVDHQRKTVTTYEITPAVVDAFNSLAEVLPKKGAVEPVYSLGFQRMELLSRKKRNALTVSYMLEGKTQEDLKAFLSAMTETEFKAFKKQK